MRFERVERIYRSIYRQTKRIRYCTNKLDLFEATCSIIESEAKHFGVIKKAIAFSVFYNRRPKKERKN